MATKIRGGRVGLWMIWAGVLLVFGGLYMGLGWEYGGFYFATIGVLMTICGGLLHAGHPTGPFAYAILLVLMWWWALKDSKLGIQEATPRVFVPTLIGLYILFPAIRWMFRRLFGKKVPVAPTPELVPNMADLRRTVAVELNAKRAARRSNRSS